MLDDAPDKPDDDGEDDREAIRKFLSARHAKRLIAGAERMTVTGLRMSDPDPAIAEGLVVTFDEAEQAKIMDVVREILADRRGAPSPEN